MGKKLPPYHLVAVKAEFLFQFLCPFFSSSGCLTAPYNAYYQQGWPALALRLLPERIPGLAEIGAWKAWQKMKEADQGLILVTGRTGSGKTTTLAAFIEELNREKSYHIVTLEEISTKDMIQTHEVPRSLVI